MASPPIWTRSESCALRLKASQSQPLLCSSSLSVGLGFCPTCKSLKRRSRSQRLFSSSWLWTCLQQKDSRGSRRKAFLINKHQNLNLKITIQRSNHLRFLSSQDLLRPCRCLASLLLKQMSYFEIRVLVNGNLSKKEFDKIVNNLPRTEIEGLRHYGYKLS